MSTDLRDGVAIIGMAGRFPGAKNLREFWRNLHDGVESVVYFSDQELQEAGVSADVASDPNYVKAAARLADIEWFDAAFFGYSAREAAVMDPQHRLFLECAWEALEEAGYAPDTYSGSIGVYAGSGANSYLTAYSHRLGTLEGDVLATFLANAADFLTTRVSYKLNLTGPSLNVQTACSTSLVAVHLACQSLLHGECDMALAGGVSIKVTDIPGYFFQEGGIASPDGHCRAFDARAQGTLFGDGVGIVVLKRVEEAIAERDHVYAVIRGSAINNDGASKVGYTAPSVRGQARVISEALAIAGVEPETIGHIETHGTGTALGDPVEIAALSQAFRAATDKKGFCAISSVKTNIGHLDAAAGIAGLIKTALMLHYEKLPPSLHFERPNPEIDFASSPFFVNTTLRDWKSGSVPRRAGVSSFGMGGTNVHVVVEEAPTPQAAPPPHAVKPSTDRPVHVLALSAKSEAAVIAVAGRFAQYFDAHPDASLADVCFTANAGRVHFPYRRAIVAASAAEARDKLSGVIAQHQAPTALDAPKVALLFTGDGSEYRGMGLRLYASQPVFRAALDRCALIARPYLDRDLTALLEVLTRDHKPAAQLALFAVEYALAELWQSWGVRPAAVVGSGAGEYAAACLAGIFSLAEAIGFIASGECSVQLANRVTYAVPRIPFLPSVMEARAEVWLEIGPNSGVEGIAGQSLRLASIRQGTDEWTQILSSLAALYERGCAVDWIGFDREYTRRRVSLPTYPFERHRYWMDARERRPVAATVSAEPAALTRPYLREELERVAPPLRLNLLINYLQEEVAQILGLDSAAAVDPHRGFFDMGMESLTALALRTRLEKGMACALPTTFAMNYPTVETFASYIATEVLGLELAPGGPVESSSEGAGDDAMLAELQDLSEDELAALVDEQVGEVLGDVSGDGARARESTT